MHRYARWVSLLGATFWVGAWAAGYQAPPDFRGHLWGASTSAFPSLELREESGDSKFYSDPTEDLSIGNAALQSITYGFYKDQLFAVLIRFEGYSNAREVLLAAEGKFGSPVRPNKYLERRFWGLQSNVNINYDYSEVTKKGALTYIYVPVRNQNKGDEEARAKRSGSQL